VTRPSFIPTWAAACIAAILLALFSLSAPVIAHEGHDHGAPAKPADVLGTTFRGAQRGRGNRRCAGRQGSAHLSRPRRDNGPIQGAQIEVEGPGIKGVATAMADGVYQLPAAALAQAGKYPLMLTIQAGEIVDLLSATLEVGEVPAAASAEGIPNARGGSRRDFAAPALRRPGRASPASPTARERAIHHV
jgi:cobalt-zinc-cadmium efflux system membrane fusion protein